MRKTLPIGNDQFSDVRRTDAYYVDKTLMIKDFIEYGDKAALITRPRRFGKTLNMTMLRDFFDITKDSRQFFEGLLIMDSKYAGQLNSRPVLYFSFKDCTASDADGLRKKLTREIYKEYVRYYAIIGEGLDPSGGYTDIFRRTYRGLREENLGFDDLCMTIELLLRIVAEYYAHSAPILLIDEYDQPILSSYEYGYQDELREFFSTFYGSALKSNEYLGQALLTGIQRVAKESIFSKLNNIIIYTVLSEKYSAYFGLTESETADLLKYYGLSLDKKSKEMYDGYLFGGKEMYNPWSILRYADSGMLESYWVNTSTNYLIRRALKDADRFFLEGFEKLISEGHAEVGLNLETSFLELSDEYSLWGLFVNSGYLTVSDRLSNEIATVTIPNYEVKKEFQALVAQYGNIPAGSLERLFLYLVHGRMDEFFDVYKRIVLAATSYYDAKENAYHMLFLGMCISLDSIYKVTSNLETGHGRSDIMLEAKTIKYPHIIIEFKQGENLTALAEEAVKQIKDKEYGAGLNGELWCVGIAHNKKDCRMIYEKRQ